MSVRLSRAFYAALLAGESNAFETAVGGRIYAIEAPASAALPLAVYSVSSVSSTGAFGGVSHLQATIDLSLFGKTQAGVDALAAIEEKAYRLLHDQDVTDAAIGRVHIRSLNRGTPLLEGEYLRLDSTFLLEGSDDPSLTA